MSDGHQASPIKSQKRVRKLKPQTPSHKTLSLSLCQSSKSNGWILKSYHVLRSAGSITTVVRSVPQRTPIDDHFKLSLTEALATSTLYSLVQSTTFFTLIESLTCRQV